MILIVAATVTACLAAETGGPSRQAPSPMPTASTERAATPAASPLAAGSAQATSGVSPAPSDLPSRVVLGRLRIDLPVISGAATLPGNPPDYPLCDVAQYLTTFRFPGRLGTTTWIYGHARPGMFLPLLEASERNAGAELLGQVVEVYSTANRRYTYRISEVLRHATDRSAAVRVPPDGGRLILQTSEGPKGTVPKLQVVAELIGSDASTTAESQPSASPRECSEP